MIRILGLSEDVFNYAIANYNDLIVSADENQHMLVLRDACELFRCKEFVRISCGDESFQFAICDFWRIEIE